MPTNFHDAGADIPNSAVRRLTNIFFLIDTSGSMADHGKIDAVNNAMHEAIPIVREFAAKDAAHKIQCSVLEFNSGVKWITEKPVDAEDLQWIDLEARGGTYLGAAYAELAKKLTRGEGGYMAKHLNNAPIIILLTDGYPLDDAAAGLATLKKSRWFDAAVRIAIEITGGDVNRQQLLDFAKGPELVIPVDSDRLQHELTNIVVASMTNSANAQDVINAVVGGRSERISEAIPSMNIDPAPISETPKPATGTIGLDDFEF